MGFSRDKDFVSIENSQHLSLLLTLKTQRFAFEFRTLNMAKQYINLHCSDMSYSSHQDPLFLSHRFNNKSPNNSQASGPRLHGVKLCAYEDPWFKKPWSSFVANHSLHPSGIPCGKFIYPYAPILSASGFGVGFGYLNTF